MPLLDTSPGDTYRQIFRGRKVISSIRGTLESTGPNWVSVNVGPVSLKAHVPTSTLAKLAGVGKAVQLYTYLQVREEDLILYAFATQEEQRFFETIIGVTGIGPRLALSILSTLEPLAVATAIASGDVVTLSHAPGVGKKTASRLILELKERLAKEWSVVAGATAPEGGEVVETLLALGYSLPEAREANSKAGSSAEPLEERLRRALQHLGRG